MLNRIIEGLLKLTVTDDIVNQVKPSKGTEGVFRKLLKAVNVHVQISTRDIEKIPKTGPLLVVANHPTGFAEGLAIPAILDSVRSDLTVMGHTFFKRWPSLSSRMVLVNPQAGGSAKAINSAGLRSAAKILRNGECLMMFPAAEVARPQTKFLNAEELLWRTGLANLVRLSGASVLPIHVSGNNGLLFRILSRIHPRLGTLLLCREFLSQRGSALQLVVGNPIPASVLTGADSPAEAVAMCRRIVLGLKARSDSVRNRQKRLFSDIRPLNLVDFSINLNQGAK
jgi:putative hemolysin